MESWFLYSSKQISRSSSRRFLEGTGDWHVMKCLDSKLDVKRERTLVLEENIITCAHDRILVLCNVF